LETRTLRRGHDVRVFTLNKRMIIADRYNRSTWRIFSMQEDELQGIATNISWSRDACAVIE
jgi:hypothetical protein